MAGITYFVALTFDVADGSVVVGEPIECPSPAVAIERAQGLWKVLGHTGAVAFSRTGDPATGDFSDAKVIRKFGDGPFPTSIRQREKLTTSTRKRDCCCVLPI
jgi:hypothetical protein